MFHASMTVKALVGKVFSNASIGEAGEKTFPTEAVSSKE